LKNFCSCCTEGAVQDDVQVFYFDRAPYAEGCNLAPFPCCCFCGMGKPKLEIIDHGWMCCCIKLDPCCMGKRVALMPYETFPPPCCCCSNRTSACDNCFGLCGPPTGNPKVHLPFYPQPMEPAQFVKAAQLAMGSVHVNTTVPESVSMQRT